MINTIHSDLIRGHIDTIILKSLYEGDRYGYDIVKEIEQKSSGQYKIKQPTLYSCLKRLEVQGFIKSYWGAKSNGGRRKYYTLTDMGRELFIKNQTEWEYSRTVIDKLISDKDFDLGSLEPTEEEKAEAAAAAEEEEREAGEELEKTARAAEDAEQAPPPLQEPQPQADGPASEQRPQEPPRSYLDTTAIMNELFNQQLAGGEKSYSKNLVESSYTPAPPPLIDSESYFRDFTDEEPEETEEEPEVEGAMNEAREEAKRILFSDPTPLPPYDAYMDRFQEPRPETEPPQSEAAAQSVGADAAQSSMFDRYFAPAPQSEEPPAPAKDEETAPQNDFYSYDAEAQIDENQLILQREYKNVLNKLVGEKAERPHPNITYKTGDDTAEVTVDAAADTVVNSSKIQTRKFQTIADSVQGLGNDIKIRTHNDTSKEYNNAYYYYSNKLLLTHYAILFALMITEIIFSFLFIKVGLKINQKYDMALYLSAVILAAAFPTTAFILNLIDAGKKKRLSFNLRNSVIFRVVIMLQCFLIIYALNIYFQMPLGFSKDYLSSLILPALLCLDLPLSAVIFNGLYKSKKFSVD